MTELFSKNIKKRTIVSKRQCLEEFCQKEQKSVFFSKMNIIRNSFNKKKIEDCSYSSKIMDFVDEKSEKGDN